MKRTSCMIGWVVLVAILAGPAFAQAPATCEQIRNTIKMQTGILKKANTDLLQVIAARQECRFTTAEVYRAAYGDKPLPKQASRASDRHHDDD